MVAEEGLVGGRKSWGAGVFGGVAVVVGVGGGNCRGGSRRRGKISPVMRQSHFESRRNQLFTLFFASVEEPKRGRRRHTLSQDQAQEEEGEARVFQFYKVDDSGKVQRLRKECPNFSGKGSGVIIFLCMYDLWS